MIEDIKKEFPNPVKCKDGWLSKGAPDGVYCVGGAFMQYINSHGIVTYAFLYDLQFPLEWRIANALARLRPSLPREAALNYAGQITRNNDNEDFDAAWDTLRKAIGE